MRNDLIFKPDNNQNIRYFTFLSFLFRLFLISEGKWCAAWKHAAPRMWQDNIIFEPVSNQARHRLFHPNKQRGVPAQPSVMNEICSSLLQSHWKPSFKIHFHWNPSFSYENLDQCHTSVHLWRITSPPPFPPFSPAIILASIYLFRNSPWKLQLLLKSSLTEIEPSVVAIKGKSRLENCENVVGDNCWFKVSYVCASAHRAIRKPFAICNYIWRQSVCPVSHVLQAAEPTVNMESQCFELDTPHTLEILREQLM